MLTVSLEAAATSLGATVAPDLLSANNPRRGKAKGALGSVARGSCPGLRLQVGAQLVAASCPSPLHPPAWEPETESAASASVSLSAAGP